MGLYFMKKIRLYKPKYYAYTNPNTTPICCC